jgi:hypothetical protein
MWLEHGWVKEKDKKDRMGMLSLSEVRKKHKGVTMCGEQIRSLLY